MNLLVRSEIDGSQPEYNKETKAIIRGTRRMLLDQWMSYMNSCYDNSHDNCCKTGMFAPVAELLGSA
jgi:hypothetical protein